MEAAKWEIVITCDVCGEKQDTILTQHMQMLRWRNGEHIQNVFPEFPPDIRELMISGTCGTCFDKMFAEDDDWR